MDAIELLKKDHHKVTELFNRFNGGSGLTGIVTRITGTLSDHQRQLAAAQICKELEVHTHIEEEVFYPAVRALGDPKLNKMLEESYREHDTVKQEVAVVRAGIRMDPELQAKMDMLQKDVDHHVREEESEMFPRVEELMDEARRVDVGTRLQARKRELARAAPTRAPAKRAAAGKPRTARGRARTKTHAARKVAKTTRGRRGRSSQTARAVARATSKTRKRSTGRGRARGRRR